MSHEHTVRKGCRRRKRKRRRRKQVKKVSHLQDSGHLHQRDKLRLHAVTEAPCQLGEQRSERPELLELLRHRNIRASPSHLRHTCWLTFSLPILVWPPGKLQWYLSKVQHTGAEGRGGAEQRLHEATAQLETLGDAPDVRFLQQREENKSEVHPPHRRQVHALKQTEHAAERGGSITKFREQEDYDVIIICLHHLHHLSGQIQRSRLSYPAFMEQAELQSWFSMLVSFSETIKLTSQQPAAETMMSGRHSPPLRKARLWPSTGSDSVSTSPSDVSLLCHYYSQLPARASRLIFTSSPFKRSLWKKVTTFNLSICAIQTTLTFPTVKVQTSTSGGWSWSKGTAWVRHITRVGYHHRFL